MIRNQAPDLFILDEPVNNLDIQNIKILTTTIKQYTETLLVVSLDSTFLDEIKITRDIEL
jgi:ATPase subunit of ABC transporter with duplicated ATPase domains